MSWEPISPELALVDPELGARARAALSEPARPPRAARPPSPAASPPPHARDHRSYPFWARVTAALWLVVLGILVGGAAIPHAQEKPRVVPKNEDATICKTEPAERAPAVPRRFGP
jgi:hypothetical protein